jgi:hypothetical protein
MHRNDERAPAWDRLIMVALCAEIWAAFLVLAVHHP